MEGAAPLRVAGDGPSALVLGFARLPEHHIAAAVRLLAEATTATDPAGSPHPALARDHPGLSSMQVMDDDTPTG